MNDNEKMDERDDWLLNLYEGTHATHPPADPEIAREAASLRDMKSLLDARPSSKPDPRTVSVVLAAARGDLAPRGERRDRAPARRQRTVALRVGAASAVAVVLIAVVGILQVDVLPPDPSTAPPVAAETGAQQADRTGPEREADPSSKSPSRPAPAEHSSTPEALAQADLNSDSSGEAALARTAPDPDLTWEERGDVIELYQRIERIGSGMDRGWEAPSVPLEMMPAGQGAGIIPVGQRR